MKIRTSLKAIMVLAGVLCLLFYPATSKADTLYYFTSDHITNPLTGEPPGGGTPPFGYVQLTPTASGVDVLVHLKASSYYFVLGASGGFDFLFSLNTASGIDVGDISITQNATYNKGNHLVAQTGDFHADGTGSWNWGITGEGQKNGLNGGFNTDIMFSVAGATIDTFIVSTGANGGWLFAADIYSGQTGNTGLVDVSVPVPEPGILILLGIAMGAIGVASWRIPKL